VAVAAGLLTAHGRDDDVEVWAVEEELLLLTDPFRQGIEIGTVTNHAHVLQDLELRVAGIDASGEQVIELASFEEAPLSGIIGDEHLVGDPAVAKEAELVSGDIQVPGLWSMRLEHELPP
jgi:hypothetical protein